MSKTLYIAKKFHGASQNLIDLANQVIENYLGQGYDLSLRQLYYQMVARVYIPNNWRSYKNFGNLISDARLAGLVDWNAIKDRGREMVVNSHWSSPKRILESAAWSFALDKWEGQANYVELMVEKQALEGVLQPVCAELDIPFTANKGYSSSSYMKEAGDRFRRQSIYGKNVHIIYLGDHDPSGVDMTRDVEDRLNLFMMGRTFTMHRVALNMDQVQKFNLPENPTKLTDSRSGAYTEKHGDSSWELDALEPAELARIVRHAVKDLCDESLFLARLAAETNMKNELQEIADRYDD